MSEQELNSYRFLSGEEPSDEMLCCIMREVAEDAEIRYTLALNSYFSESRVKADEKKDFWASRMARLRNG